MDQDRQVKASGSDTSDEKKIADKEAATGKLVKLRAFNIFASKVRDTVKDENPGTNGHEIKRIVGQKWAQLANGDKQGYLDVAQNENDLIEKLPVDPNAPKRKRRTKMKAEIDTDEGSTQLKPQERGRTWGTDDRNNDETDIGFLEAADGRAKAKKVRKGVASRKGADAAHVGNAGNGTVDGSSDAGYLITVRVGDTDMVFRGVLFDPFVAMPPSNRNHVAPGAKSVKRNDSTVLPPRGPTSSSKQIIRGAGLPSGTGSAVR